MSTIWFALGFLLAPWSTYHWIWFLFLFLFYFFLVFSVHRLVFFFFVFDYNWLVNFICQMLLHSQVYLSIPNSAASNVNAFGFLRSCFFIHLIGKMLGRNESKSTCVHLHCNSHETLWKCWKRRLKFVQIGNNWICGSSFVSNQKPIEWTEYYFIDHAISEMYQANRVFSKLWIVINSDYVDQARLLVFWIDS